MKFAKLSLAAVVAAGALTSLSAASLEEAIKGVDISGMLRIRADYNNSTSNETGVKNPNATSYRFQGIATLTVPVADNLKSVISTRYNTNTTNSAAQELGYTTYNAAGTETGGSASDKNVAISRAYFQFAANNFIFKAGKMEIGSPWTDNNLLDGQSGNGLFLAYTGVENWTFAAANFFNTFAGYGAGDGGLGILGSPAFGSKNLTAVAVIGSVGPVNARLWASKLENVFKHAIFFEVGAKYAGFSGRAQVNNLKLTDTVAKDLFDNHSKNTFWGAEVGYNYDFFGVKAGYTKNGKSGVYSLEDDSEFIRAGKLLYQTYNNQPEAKTWFITATAKFAKYSVGAGYVQSKASQIDLADGSDVWSNELKGKEWYIEAGYAYSKNFQLNAFYSDVKFSGGNDGNASFNNTDDAKKRTRARIEGVYKF